MASRIQRQDQRLHLITDRIPCDFRQPTHRPRLHRREHCNLRSRILRRSQGAARSSQHVRIIAPTRRFCRLRIFLGFASASVGTIQSELGNPT